MSFSDFIGSLLGGGGGNNADYIGGSDMGGYTGSGNNQNTYGPYENMSLSEYQQQYGGSDNKGGSKSNSNNSGNGGGKPKPKTIDELMAEFDVSPYVPSGPSTSYMPFYNAIPLNYADTAGPQSRAMGMDFGNMVQQSLLAAPQPSMPSGILGPSMQSQTPLTAPISYEDFLRYYRGGQ
jgi:hypothetical protein